MRRRLFLQVECEEGSGPQTRENKVDNGGQTTTNTESFAARMFEARESAVDLALGLEEKVC